MAVKIIIGICIIIASFIYILKNHDKSMLENMREKQKKRMEAQQAAEAVRQEKESEK